MTLYRLKNADVEAWQISGEADAAILAHTGMRDGDWIVIRADGSFEAMPDWRFRWLYEPQPLESPPVLDTMGGEG